MQEYARSIQREKGIDFKHAWKSFHHLNASISKVYDGRVVKAREY